MIKEAKQLSIYVSFEAKIYQLIRKEEDLKNHPDY
jgi:hypothetical protein